MEKELEEILKDYMTPRQIELALPRVLRLFNVVGRSEQLAHCTDDDHSARRFFGGEKQCGKCGHPLR